MKTIKSIEDFIGLANQSKSNRYFFSNEAMKEFNSSIENWRVINDKSILFITREKYPLGTVGYTVHVPCARSSKKKPRSFEMLAQGCLVITKASKK